MRPTSHRAAVLSCSTSRCERASPFESLAKIFSISSLVASSAKGKTRAWSVARAPMPWKNSCLLSRAAAKASNESILIPAAAASFSL